MPTAALRDFRSIVIEQHLEKMFQAIVTAKSIDRAAYQAKFDKFAADATKLNDTFLQARVYSVRGTFHLTISELAEAKRCYVEARACYLAAGAIDRVIGMESNLGLMEMQRGNYAESIVIFRDSLSRLDPDDPNSKFSISNIAINLSMALMACNEYGEALHWLEQTLLNYGETLEFLRTRVDDGVYIIEQRVLLGMAQLGVGLVSEAIDSVRLARDFIRHIDMSYARLLSLVLLLRLTAGGHLKGAIDELLTQIDSEIVPPAHLYVFATLREEGRYYAQHGKLDLARWFGERALAESTSLHSDELIATARPLLAGV